MAGAGCKQKKTIMPLAATFPPSHVSLEGTRRHPALNAPR